MQTYVSRGIMFPVGPLHSKVVLTHSKIIIRDKQDITAPSFLQKFQSLFGVSPTVATRLWNKSVHLHPCGSRPIHLLYALLFLKHYSKESVNSSMCRTTEKTFRKWSWLFVRILSKLQVVSLQKRITDNSFHRAFLVIDGVDCKIKEPSPFNEKWFSHKFKGPGLRYKVGTSIHSSNIVWIYGPFPCGSFTDLKIFQRRLKHLLWDGEKIVADNGYIDERMLDRENLNYDDKQKFSLLRARHEVLNRRLKQFSVLGSKFRHHLGHHGICFTAVANIVQTCLSMEGSLFQIDDM